MDKYLFLDVDGVIATPQTIVDGMWALTLEKQKLLGVILDQTDAKIVMSSSWRKHTLNDTIGYMKQEGFLYCDKIVGVTIRAYQYIEKGIHLSVPRGVEIKQWVDTNIHSKNGKEWKRKKVGLEYNYVILDDNADMLLEHAKHFVRTDPIKGLSEQDVEKAIKILNEFC